MIHRRRTDFHVMELLSPFSINLQLSLFFLGILCLDANQQHINGEPPMCPDGCTCATDKTIVCAGLELTVVPIHLPKDTKHLDLRDNQINKLSRQTFEGLVELEQLNLHGNDIQTFGSEVINGLPLLRELDITQNALLCDCRIAWMGNWTGADLMLDRLTCNSPTSYHGTKVLAALRHLDCPKVRHKRQGDLAEGSYCDSDPCVNGATCWDDSSGYHCVCRSGYTGTRCDRWTTTLPPLDVEFSDVTSESLLVTWWFPVVPLESFHVLYTASSNQQMYMLLSNERTFPPNVRTWSIQNLQPFTRYTICVIAIRALGRTDVKQCAFTETLDVIHRDGGRDGGHDKDKDHDSDHGRDHDSDHGRDHDSDHSRDHDSDHSRDHDGGPGGDRKSPPPPSHGGPGGVHDKSPPAPSPKPHQHLMIAFGITMALCLMAILLVTVLYFKRYHSRRGDDASSTTQQNSRDHYGNTICGGSSTTGRNDIPTISVVDMSAGPPPNAPPNTPTLPSYETAMQEQPYSSFVNQAMNKDGILTSRL